MIAAQSNAPRKLTDWLVHFGWEPIERLQSEYHLPAPRSAAVLRKSYSSSQSSWQEWSLTTPEILTPDLGAIFAANRQLLGPWKFVTASDGQILCRGDIPSDVLVTDDSFDLATGQTSSPLECWAEATTALAKGSGISSQHPKPALQNLVDWLKEHGFVASADGNTVKVTVPLSGAFREITIDWQENGFAHLSAEMARLEKWEEPSARAAADLLHEANRRLRLARIGLIPETKTYSMEVCVRAPGPGAWLQSALEALCTGMALVYQPLAWLWDQSVADMLLAGRSANKSGGAP